MIVTQIGMYTSKSSESHRDYYREIYIANSSVLCLYIYCILLGCYNILVIIRRTSVFQNDLTDWSLEPTESTGSSEIPIRDESIVSHDNKYKTDCTQALFTCRHFWQLFYTWLCILLYLLAVIEHVIELSQACWSVWINGLQVLHLHPGVTNSSLYLCLSKRPPHIQTPHTLYHTDTWSSSFCGPVTENWTLEKVGSKEINTWRKPIPE